MEIIGYLASVLTGISLGMIGGGGSILIVPILIYLFAVDPIYATAYSLLVVGTTSLVGITPRYKENIIDLKIALLFGIPSTLAVILARKVILPAIPEELLLGNQLVISRSSLIMLFFAIIMILAALFMIFRQENIEDNDEQNSPANKNLVIPEAILVGTISGISGAGGGFLIIPLLTILNKIPIKKAIGTSLVIIGVQSIIGFISGMDAIIVDWLLLLKVILLSIAGFFAGSYLSVKILGVQLKNAFGWFLLVIGIYITWKEFPFWHFI
jgi:uncharacterized membrane protein YfcA